LVDKLTFFLELQKKAATLVGKEEALFVSSGTMGNLIAGKSLNILYFLLKSRLKERLMNLFLFI